jgi:hydrogenase maturation protease
VTIEAVRAIADAVLYEGYMLYPYRKSALKNRQRWTFGGVFPRSCAERGGERWYMQCECLVRGDTATMIDAQVRFLQTVRRRHARPEPEHQHNVSFPAKAGSVEACSAVVTEEGTPDTAQPSSERRLGGPLSRVMTEEVYVDLQSIGAGHDEALEREVALGPAALADILAQTHTTDFEFSVTDELEPLRGAAALRAIAVADKVFRLTLRLENRCEIPPAPDASRERALPFSFASSHAILSVADGEFLSLIDPPQDLATAARDCSNEGCWPVLAGMEGKGEAMLAAPITLYDYPQIAPESGGDLFDGTEIDEILILRTLAMTDAEKAEIAAGDSRVRAVLERIESMSPEQLGRLHGAWRSLGHAPQLASVGRGRFAVGNRVKLKPRAGGDIMDIALAGKTAVIEAIERDFEDRMHIAVVLDDDPGREFGLERLPGHRFFFSPEEIEIVGAGAEA